MKLGDLSIEEINLILEALSRQPYEQVWQLIAKLRQQAQAQIDARAQPEAPPSPG